MDYYDLVYGILSNRGEEYAKSYPEINDKNVFSISSLAWSSAKQIYWKVANSKGLESKQLSLAMTRGRAIHEFIQHRLKGFVCEYPVTYSTMKYKLIGHADAIDFKDKMILEFKTTTQEKGERWNPWIIQIGAYCKLLQLETGFPFNGMIFCVNEGSKKLVKYEISSTEINSSWKIILERAEECYRKIFELENK